MQTGTEMSGQQVAFHSNEPASDFLDTSREIADESSSGEEFPSRRSALFGMRAAVPLALLFWGLIAALVWAFRR